MSAEANHPAPSTSRGAKSVSATRFIPADAGVIFDLLADPSRHHEIDGEETVQSARGSGERLGPGSSFGMNMKILGVPYIIKNHVTAFEEGRLIEWRHFGHHRWRYELEPVEGGTIVTETFDWGPARFPPMYEWVGYPDRHEVGMAATLERLEAVVTA